MMVNVSIPAGLDELNRMSQELAADSEPSHILCDGQLVNVSGDLRHKCIQYIDTQSSANQPSRGLRRLEAREYAGKTYATAFENQVPADAFVGRERNQHGLLAVHRHSSPSSVIQPFIAGKQAKRTESLRSSDFLEQRLRHAHKLGENSAHHHPLHGQLHHHQHAMLCVLTFSRA